MIKASDFIPAGKSAQTKAREAFFLDFAKEIRTHFPQVPLIVTGGFRSRRGMEAAVTGGDCDMIGLGRPAALNPSLPNNTVFNYEVKDQDAVLYRKKIDPSWILRQLGIGYTIGAGAETVRALLANPQYMWLTTGNNRIGMPSR